MPFRENVSELCTVRCYRPHRWCFTRIFLPLFLLKYVFHCCAFARFLLFYLVLFVLFFRFLLEIVYGTAEKQIFAGASNQRKASSWTFKKRKKAVLCYRLRSCKHRATHSTALAERLTRGTKLEG